MLFLLLGLLPACVTIPSSSSPYYRFAEEDCYGQATLGTQFHCAQGKWVNGPLVGSSSVESKDKKN